MSTSYKITWKGEIVKANVRAAAAMGINETMGDCIIMAKQLVRVKTATLQGSIRLTPAIQLGNHVRGVWGSFDVNYALWQEVGTSKMSAQPYLRPSAAAHYSSLAGRIRAHLK